MVEQVFLVVKTKISANQNTTRFFGNENGKSLVRTQKDEEIAKTINYLFNWDFWNSMAKDKKFQKDKAIGNFCLVFYIDYSWLRKL